MPDADHGVDQPKPAPLRIVIAAPIRPGATSGNDVTAARWAQRLRELGHESEVAAVDPSLLPTLTPEVVDAFAAADLMIVLHARRCAAVVGWWDEHRPERPLVVGLAGTDLYVDLPEDRTVRASLDRADRIVVLQPAAIDRLRSLNPSWAERARVIHQSVDPPLPERELPAMFDSDRPLVVAVSAHLRDVKDPLLAARAARLLPPDSRIRVEHVGAAHSDDWAVAAREEMASNPRYVWRGEVDRPHALEMIAGSDVLACTSRFEGGANVVTEAIAMGVPVIGTRIDGNIGLLGADHPGLVPVGDEVALAALLREIETSSTLLGELTERSRARQVMTLPATEREVWARLIEGMVGSAE